MFRRHILRERDHPGGLAPTYIAANATWLLDHGYHVIIEGILHAAKYRPMLSELLAQHTGPTHVWYLDVPFEETILRHAQRPQAAEFTPEDMATWYTPNDLLGIDGERVIAHPATVDESVDLIADSAGWPAN